MLLCRGSSQNIRAFQKRTGNFAHAHTWKTLYVLMSPVWNQKSLTTISHKATWAVIEVLGLASCHTRLRKPCRETLYYNSLDNSLKSSDDAGTWLGVPNPFPSSDPSVDLSICLSIYLSVCLSVCLCASICLPVYLSTYLSICLAVCLSICGAVSFSVV